MGAHKCVISVGMFRDKQPPPRWVASPPSWGLLDVAEGARGTSCERSWCDGALRAVNTGVSTSPRSIQV